MIQDILLGGQLFSSATNLISVILILPLHEKEYSLRKVSSLAYNKSNTVKAGV